MLDSILLGARILSFIFIFVIVFLDKKKPESTIAWILVLLFLPYVGVFFYIMLSDYFHFNIRNKEKKKFNVDKEYKEIINKHLSHIYDDYSLKNKEMKDLIVLNYSSGAFLTDNNKIDIYKNGIDKMNDLYRDIKNAKKFIHISYYIIRMDDYGKKLVDLLTSKAKEGVEVRLIFDHIGSRGTLKYSFKELIKAGGKVEKFFPSTFNLKPYLNHRNHRKIVIIDGEIGYIGGMNIGKEYCNEDTKLYPWNDRHIRIYGDATNCLQIQFFLDYTFVSREKIDLRKKDVIEKYFKNVDSKDKKLVQIVSSGPDYENENIKNAYLKMINNAKKSIIIETPYLILDDSVMDALSIASKSGVDIKVVIPLIPDKKFVYAATMSYARELIKLGIKVYAYKGFLHSKVVIVDDYVTSIGSANMDRRSFYLNFESNAIIYDKEFNDENRLIVEEDILNSEYLNVTIKKKKKFGLWLERIFRLLAPLI